MWQSVKLLPLAQFLIVLETLQDAIVLARTLKDAIGGAEIGNGQLNSLVSTRVDAALRDFERERTRRKLKISVKSNFMGFALQIPFAPVSVLQTPLIPQLLRKWPNVWL